MANELIIRHGLISKGGVTVPFATASGDFTATTANDYYIEVTASGGNVTGTLETPVREGQIFVIKNKYSSDSKVTLQTEGSETIDGENTLTLSPNESVQLTTDGTNWVTISESGADIGAGCHETDIESVGNTFVTPSTDKITLDNQLPNQQRVTVNKTQNGVDISAILETFEANAGLITITDINDEYCSFIPATITTGTTWVAFTVSDGNVSGTLLENMSTGSAVICFTPYTNGTSGSSGSSGTSGSSGSSGTSGSSGSSGTSGSSGSSGTSGSSGSSGTSGSSGSSGTSGSSGSSGTSGSSGSSGTSGSSGSSGTSGSSGSSGTSGSSGSSGTSGSSGSSGTSGSSGSSGTSGSSGSSGTSGSSGSSGTSGSSGSSGTSGSSGSSGTSGSSGSSGTSGSSGSSGTSGSSGSSGTSGSSGSSGTSGSSGSSGTSGSSGSSG